MENTRPLYPKNNHEKSMMDFPLSKERLKVPTQGNIPKYTEAFFAERRPYYPETIQPETQKEILSFLRTRKIEFLTHFTRIENLKSILKEGILSRAQLIREKKNFQFNAPDLPEAWQNAASLNISFPDYKLFYNLQERMGHEWIVILINAKILANQPFYYFNGPASETIFQPNFPSLVLPFLQRFQTMTSLFGDSESISRAKLAIPDNYTTNPQSEVLTFSPISPQYIREIHFYNDYKFSQWFYANSDFAIGFDKKIWFSDLTYFSPRCDYNYWKSTPSFLSGKK